MTIQIIRTVSSYSPHASYKVFIVLRMGESFKKITNILLFLIHCFTKINQFSYNTLRLMTFLFPAYLNRRLLIMNLVWLAANLTVV